jgi:hypothetical protein
VSLLLVGESNPWGGADMALYHLPRQASGNRLREHLGLMDATYEEIAKTNLCEPEWEKDQARAHASKILAYPGWKVVVMLGVKVKAAFGVPKMEAFSAQGILVALPHPSGLNQQWNDPRARKEARALLSRVAPWVPWGEVA